MYRTSALRFVFFTALFCYCSSVKAQFQFIYNDSVPVVKLGNALKFPWAGGLNYPQFSELDYDYDGDLDLIAFDRSNDQIKVFEHVVQAGAHSYQWNPYGSSFFPNDLRYRLYFADYNLDGKND